ncbi:MAG: HdeA/HdeB family chaperone [Methyloceanibacter sp.]
MKALCAAALAVVFLSVSPALAAETIDVAELTCEQFTKYGDDNRGTMMMWFEGYYTEEDEPAVIDFGKMAGHLTELLIKCEANPDKKVLEFTEEIMDD